MTNRIILALITHDVPNTMRIFGIAILGILHGQGSCFLFGDAENNLVSRPRNPLHISAEQSAALARLAGEICKGFPRRGTTKEQGDE